jgi:hypothetical protein
MGLDNYIEFAMKSLLRNPIIDVLRAINISKILIQSNFIKRSVGYSPFQILLHFVYMLVMNKRQSAFVRQNTYSYCKDTYYRFTKDSRYNWRKLLLLGCAALIKKIEPLQKSSEYRLLIIDDTVEAKRGKLIEGSCRHIYSNKEKRCINGINMVSLNFCDSYSTFQLDFCLKTNDSRRLQTSDFTTDVHHKSNAHKRRVESESSKNTLATQMLSRALDYGIEADYLLVDSWYAKPSFIKESIELGMPVIARVPNNALIWNFMGKHKTIDAIYNSLKDVKRTYSGKHGKISFTYFDAVVEHKTVGRCKLVFLHTGAELLVFIATDISLSGKQILEIYKKRWNIEQGYKDLRAYFGFGAEENRIYEALIGRLTLSMFTYNILSYINRISHEPKTLGELFRDLECELQTLAISMERFLEILTAVANITEIVNENKDLLKIITLMRAYAQKELGFMCES